jgi:hypothetical protein
MTRLITIIPPDSCALASVLPPRFANSGALDLPSARVWVAEQHLQQDGQGLHVARWERNETAPGNPCLWR